MPIPGDIEIPVFFFVDIMTFDPFASVEIPIPVPVSVPAPTCTFTSTGNAGTIDWSKINWLEIFVGILLGIIIQEIMRD
jgi:hypothetical protein